MSLRALTLLCLIAAIHFVLPRRAQLSEPEWRRHTIDPTKGAIDVRMRDVDGDGAPDIVAVYAGGAIRIYRNSNKASAPGEWSTIEAGIATGTSSAALADLNADGHRDVITPLESGRILIHWAPAEGTEWRTEPLADAPPLMWSAVVASNIDRRHGRDLIAGAKYRDAKIGWFESLADPGESAGWRWHPLADVGWLADLLITDMDGDGNRDILFADRLGSRRGIHWLENPGRTQDNWHRHQVSVEPSEFVFFTMADFDRDGFVDIVSAAKPRQIWFHRRRASHGRAWQNYLVDPTEKIGTVTAVRVTDVNSDMRPDLVVASEEAAAGQSGIVWLSYSRSMVEQDWRVQDISGTDGGDFHGLELVDLDGDGDLDVLTSETRNLGVVWYENPSVDASKIRKK